MEQVVQLHIEKLPEGVYLATSDEVQGLVAQGCAIQETIEIARDVATKLNEGQLGGYGGILPHRQLTKCSTTNLFTWRGHGRQQK